LVLLDIQMPLMDGFEVLRRLRGPLPAIIFVTAFSEHALRAFEVGAADYLLKPVHPERLRKAVERVRTGPSAARRVAATLNAERQTNGRTDAKIVARKGHDYYLLGHDEVYAFQADGELVWILTDKDRYLAADTLKTIEERLGSSGFQRVHRGALVNTAKIRKFTSISSQRWLLTLSNGVQLTVSKRLAPLVREILS
jgi:DNA-binding LytR/AlgR family response regulator